MSGSLHVPDTTLSQEEARYKVILPHILEDRVFSFADVHTVGTAGSESAARRRIHGKGDTADDVDAVTFFRRIRDGDGRE